MRKAALAGDGLCKRRRRLASCDETVVAIHAPDGPLADLALLLAEFAARDALERLRPHLFAGVEMASRPDCFEGCPAMRGLPMEFASWHHEERGPWIRESRLTPILRSRWTTAVPRIEAASACGRSSCPRPKERSFADPILPAL